MAYIQLFAPETSLIRVFFGVDAAVGPGQPNRREDVLLVQYSLRAMAGKEYDLGKGNFIGVPGKPPIAVDGVCGINTIAAIKRFQSLYHEGKVKDGVVDPNPPGQTHGRRHGSTYTIIGLNTNHAGFFNKHRHAQMGVQPDYPAELKAKFYVR